MKQLIERLEKAKRELACERCSNRGFVWIMVEGVNEKDECPVCRGAGRNHATIELLSGLVEASLKARDSQGEENNG